MNEIVQSLYTKSVGKKWTSEFDPVIVERFTETVVEYLCEQVMSELNIWSTRTEVQKFIKKSLGVEE